MTNQRYVFLYSNSALIHIAEHSSDPSSLPGAPGTSPFGPELPRQRADVIDPALVGHDAIGIPFDDDYAVQGR